MSQRAQRRPSGFTLIEIMVVVAIVSVLAAISGTAFMNIVRSGRVLSTGKSLVSALRSARLRAMTTTCPHFIQVNGPSYSAATTSGFPNKRGRVYIVRKADCASLVTQYEVGDRVVDDFPLGTDERTKAIEYRVDASVLPAVVLDDASLTIGYDALGAVTVMVDGSHSGLGTFSPAPNVTALMELRELAPGSGTTAIHGVLSVPSLAQADYSQ